MYRSLSTLRLIRFRSTQIRTAPDFYKTGTIDVHQGFVISSITPADLRRSNSSLTFGNIGIDTLRATVTTDGWASSFRMIFTCSVFRHPTPSVIASSSVMRFICEATPPRLRRFSTSFTPTMTRKWYTVPFYVAFAMNCPRQFSGPPGL